MRSFRLFLTATCCLLAAITLVAAPSTVSYQGRLTDASNSPVADGTYSATFRLFTTDIGGSSIWLEVQDIVCSQGLFSAELGRMSPIMDSLVKHGSGQLWLEVEVQGATLSPRMRLGAAPAAAMSHSTAGTGGLSGLPGSQARVYMAPTDSGAISSASIDKDYDGIPDIGFEASAKVPRSVLKSYFETGDKPTQSQFSVVLDETGISSSSLVDLDDDGIAERTMNSKADNDGVIDYLDMDSDDDGIADRSLHSDIKPQCATTHLRCVQGGDTFSVSDSVDETSASFGVTRSSGGGFTTDGWQMLSAIDHNSLSCTSLNGLPPGEPALGSLVMLTDLQTSSITIGDVDRDGQLDFRCTPDSVSQSSSISDGGETASSNMRTRVNDLESKLQNLGLLHTTSVSSICDASSAKHAINTKGTGAQGGRLVFVSGSTGSASAVHSTGLDDDGDGVPEQEISSAITPTKAQHAINTKGTGAQGGRVVSVSSGTDVDSAFKEVTFYSPPDGAMLLPSLMKAKEKANKTKCSNNLRAMGGNGTTTEGDLSCDTAAATFTLSGSSSVSASIGTMSLSVSSDSVKDIREITDGLEWSIHRAVHGKGGVSRTASSHGGSHDNTVDEDCDGISSRTTWGSSSTLGTSASVTIQADASGAANPIEHSSGAHLTIGGDWINASDENLKENFQPVDGSDILEKIEELPILQWNYRSQSDEVTHIGPTAQDFKEVFGVGSNDKTISTIDPSGIALAAIKQLSKENNELKSQVAELKKMVEELAKKK